jgi:electron transport complex protein RnfE
MVLLESFDPALFGSFGIYLPIMAVNSLIVLRCERFAVRLKPMAALRDGLTASVGYGIVILIVGAVREVIGSGSLLGYRFWDGHTLNAMLLPFGGFLVLGFASAVLRYVISLTWPKYLDKKQPKPRPASRQLPAEPEQKPQTPAAAAPARQEPVFEPENTDIDISAGGFDTQKFTIAPTDGEG